MEKPNQIIAALTLLQSFAKTGLTPRIRSLELLFQGAERDKVPGVLQSNHITSDLLKSAYQIKNISKEINATIHTVGILLSLPTILKPEEQIKYLSLAAGNTGRKFDLETNLRIAEYKFINWRGGSETIRQNSVFKDFYHLAEENTTKEKHLYLIGTTHALKFLNGERALESIMSKNVRLWTNFSNKYPNRFKTVREYYLFKKTSVQIEDLSPYLPSIADVLSTN